MALDVYYDLMSQVSRSVYMFLRLNKIPYNDKPVALRKGEHMADDYTTIHPFRLVPAINDNGFRLTESVAIVDYLTRTRKVPDHWYPADTKKRARINEYLHWQHVNTRTQSAMLFQHLLLIPRMTGKPADQDQVRKWRKGVQKVVTNLEGYFLRDTPFISSDVITVADIFCACELMQLYAVNEEAMYEKIPAVKAWMERVQRETNPVFDDAHTVVYSVRKMYTKSKL